MTNLNTSLLNNLGSYVSYKNEIYLIMSDTLGESMCHILAMGNHSKLHVAIKNVEVLPIRPAVVVSYKMAKYVVTKKGNIFSCTTKRLMAWQDGNGDRKAILTLAK